jgi:hypothetical protein
MKYTGRLAIALVLSCLIHLGVVAYLNYKPIDAFGVGTKIEEPKYMQVELITDVTIPQGESPPEVDRSLREEQLKKALQDQGDRPFEEMPLPEQPLDIPEDPLAPDLPEEVPEVPEWEQASAEGSEEALALEVIQIPEARVDAPNPETRSWVEPQKRDLPEMKVAAAPRPVPAPAPVLDEQVKVPEADPMKLVESLEEEPLRAAPSVELPTGILVSVPKEIEFDEAFFAGDRKPVANWDDYLEVDIETYRPNPEPGYFRITVRPNEKAKDLRAMYKDVLFAIDASGSMEESVFAELKESLIAALSGLRDKDRFNVLGFKADVVALNPSLWPATSSAKKQAEEFVRSLQPSGKTDIYRSLSAIAQSLPPGDRPFLIVLFSDGMPTVGIKDSRDLINRVTIQNNRRASIHVVGVGEMVNRYLLELLAYRNKGMARFFTKKDTLRANIAHLMGELQEPILMDPTVDLSGLPGRDAYPEVLPDLYRGGSLRIYGRYDRERELVLRLAGNARGNLKDFVFRGDLPVLQQENAVIAREWAAAKAYDLVAENCAEGDSPARLATIKDLSDSFNLKFPF